MAILWVTPGAATIAQNSCTFHEHALGFSCFRVQTDFESKFEAERISRLEREGRILKQLADHEQEVATDFETERVRFSSR